MQQPLTQGRHQAHAHPNIHIAIQMHTITHVAINQPVKIKVGKIIVVKIIAAKVEKIIHAYVATVKCLDMGVLLLLRYQRITLK